MVEILDIALFVAGTLEQLRVPYLIGGSLASSLHGIPRATQDVDFVARLQQAHHAPLVSAWRDAFYLDERAIRDAIDQRASFNIVHLQTMFKVDVFVARDDLASRYQFERSQRFVITEDPHRELVVAGPEDVVAQKLYWFRLGDETSDRQWSDAVGVLKVGSGRLDVAYLRVVARLLDVENLLYRACQEAGIVLDA